MCGQRPCSEKKLIPASRAVWAWKSSWAWAESKIDVPASTRIAHLYHMLFFALATGVGTNGAHIFKIDLHLCQWLMERFLTRRNGWIRHQQSQPAQQLPSRARRTSELASSLA